MTSFTLSGGRLFFAADDGTSGTELWMTDGTPGGTARVVEINPTGPAAPQAFVDLFGTLYFAATDGIFGFEVWKSDGTPAGTTRETDIAALGPCAARAPRTLRAGSSALYFVADDALTGFELWTIAVTPPAGCNVAVVRDATSVGKTAPWVYTTSCPALGANTVDGTIQLTVPLNDTDLTGESTSGGAALAGSEAGADWEIPGEIWALR